MDELEERVKRLEENEERTTCAIYIAAGCVMLVAALVALGWL